MAYLYFHITKGTDEIFYVGVSISSRDGYHRAKCKTGRNPHWNSVANKHGWRWHVFIDGVSNEDIFKYEKEIIAGWGKRISGGVLVNMSDGGESTAIESMREKIAKIAPWNKGMTGLRSSWNKGIPTSAATRQKQSDIKKGKYCGEKHPMWGRKANGCQILINKMHRLGGVPWNKGIPMTEDRRVSNKFSKPSRGVIQMSMNGDYICEYHSLSDACSSTGINKGSISCACTGLRSTKSAGGYKWKYASELTKKRPQPLMQQPSELSSIF